MIDMALSSVMWRSPGATVLLRMTICKYLRAGSVEPKFTFPNRPRKQNAFANKLSAWLQAVWPCVRTVCRADGRGRAGFALAIYFESSM